MSLINWLSQKQTPKAAGHAPEVPAHTAAGAPDSKPSGGRRAERVERREQLYAVVRHAMSSAGVLSASYKFKVLSLDSRGTSFLVMMDLASHAAEDPERMSELEALIAQNAKNRFDIVVAAVYWRLSDYVAAGLSHRPALTTKPQVPGQASPASSAAPSLAASALPSAASMLPVGSAAAPVRPPQRAQPVDKDEVLAFKNAFSVQGKGAPLYASGEIQKSGKRSTVPVRQDFSDAGDLEDRISPLGPTQYGDLN